MTDHSLTDTFFSIFGMTEITPENDIPDVSVAALIDRSHEARNTQRERFHLGVSEVGHHCERRVWLGFRWALPTFKPGRLLRLFRRGHNEEETVVADLEAIGCTVTDRQRRVSLGGHLSGSIDGIVHGVPEAPKTPHLLEIKTANTSSFREMEKVGVQAAKPEHDVQMQLYMHALKLKRALYVMVCKETDELHIERIKYDRKVAEAFIERGHRLSTDDEVPPRISDRPDWWRCKMCDAHDLCHESKLSREVNCRTCALVTPRSDGTWYCTRWGAAVPNEHQEKGCPSHVLHPDLVPWERESIGEPYHAVYDGRVNGGPELEGAVPSVEIVSGQQKGTES